MAIGPAAATALPQLWAAAGRGEVEAAVAVWRLAGETDPLLHAVEWAVGHDQFCASAIDQLLELGGRARPLLGSLQRFLTGEPAGTFPAREAQMAAARVVWRLTGDPDAVLPTVRAVIAAGDQPAGTAAMLAVELGSHARPLVGLLREALDGHWTRVDAAHALWPLGGSTAELVGPLLAAVGDGWGHGWAAALDLLINMRAIQAVPRLHELAEQDARVLTGGSVDDIVRGDQALRARLLDAIQRLEA
jgi:hypothetical protein